MHAATICACVRLVSVRHAMPDHALTSLPLLCQADEAAFIVLVSEEDGSSLVRARVHMEDIYTRQQGAVARLQPVERALAPLVPTAAACSVLTVCSLSRCLSLAISPADTILSWSEPETSTDYALSFQEGVRSGEGAKQQAVTAKEAKEESGSEP